MLDKTFINYEVSTGTLQDEDLIEAFEDFLEENAPAIFNTAMSHRDDVLDQDDYSWYLNEVLFDLMNCIAPVGTYFGSHPGDGACFGYWPGEDWDNIGFEDA